MPSAAPFAFTEPDAAYQDDFLTTLGETHAAMMDAALQGDGMERIAELAARAAGGAVAVVIPPLRVALASHERRAPVDLTALERWVSELVEGSPSTVPRDVVAQAPIRLRDGLAGVVALLGAGQPPRLEVCELLRLAAAAAVTELAIEEAREQTERSLRGSFLEELRSRDDLSGPEIVRRASRLGCDLSRGAVMLCVELTVERPGLVMAMIDAEHPGALAQELDAGSQARRRVYAALPALDGCGTARSSTDSGSRLAARLEPYGTTGASSFHADPAELPQALREAEFVLEVVRQSGAAATDQIANGTYKLLYRLLASHAQEAREFYESTIAAMVRYDEQNRTDLVRTLSAYLEANCNMNETAAAIYAHRHTVASRLERIRELTALDPTRYEDRERLGLGLKMHRLLAAGAASRA